MLIKNYEDNIVVYYILFIKVIINILVYVIFILLKNEVLFCLIKRYFCYLNLKLILIK